MLWSPLVAEAGVALTVMCTVIFLWQPRRAEPRRLPLDLAPLILDVVLRGEKHILMQTVAFPWHAAAV